MKKIKCFDKTLSSLAPWKCNDPFETMKEESEAGHLGTLSGLYVPSPMLSHIQTFLTSRGDRTFE